MTTGPRTAEEELAQRLLDGLELGLALLEPTGEIRLANRAAEAFFGYGAGELAGRALADLYEPPDRAAGAPARALAAACRDGRVQDDGPRVRRDGSIVHFGFVLTRLPSASDVSGAGGFTLEMRETADRSPAQPALRDEFLAALSHELRTPLTAIVGWATLLRTGNLDEKGRERALETIERNARVEAQLTSDILDVARIVTGKMHVEIQNVDAAKVVESAVETVRPTAEGKGVAVTLAAEGATDVAADPDRLQQVVGNLLANAIKFTPSGGEVCVRVASSAQDVVIEIRDTGEGIAPEILPHVFERLRQGGGQGYRKGGLGLGLAIVSHIVALHAGQVRADSAGQGQGSTFTVHLPSRTQPPMAAEAVVAALAGHR
jgi:PAS domain S-box-containing protein